MSSSQRRKISKVKKTSGEHHQEESNIVANRYSVTKKLGSGSYGTVFVVSDLKTSEAEKVLKKIHIGDLEPNETISAVSEARLLSKLDHPGVVRFHDSFIDREFFCIITEFCEGGDLDVKLHSWKKSGKSVDRTLVLTWFVQLIVAVQYIHQRRILHRDLKTRNIFLKNNIVKIGDFGISRILEGSTDIATTFTGTPYFMAPEILKHEGYNSKSDIWSLGVILYETCTLKKAFQGNNLMAVMKNIVHGDIPKLPSKFNADLHLIYESMLCRDSAKRSSATEILKKPYIMQYLEKLKLKLSGNRTIDRKIAKREAMEIADALSSGEKCSKSNVKRRGDRLLPGLNNNQRPLTPKELMKIRKQQRADEELEKLKKLTVKTYAESRRECTDIKNRLEHASVEDEKDENIHSSPRENNRDDDKLCNIEMNIIEATEDERRRNLPFKRDDSLEVCELPADDVFECGGGDERVKEDRAHIYTHCFGEEEEETQHHMRKYTHCFGASSSEDEQDCISNTLVVDQSEDGVFSGEEDEDVGDDTNDLTNVSSIPESADLADTYYSNYDDFESDVSSDDDDEELSASDESDADGKTSGDYDALVGCMENALDLSEEDVQSTFGDSLPSLNATSNGLPIRQQKILKLRKECIGLLGEEGFHKVYEYLDKVRFSGQRTVSEDTIMKRLRKLVGSSRDCFLVDQLLFLEKQNEIFDETF
eukprot:TCONS_00057400-protein